jgi:DNA-binding HxlR family transcriptional regulator
MKVHHGCPVQATIQVLSGKWKVQAVWRLSFGPLRRNQKGSTFITAESHLLAQPIRRDVGPTARKPLRLGLQTIWH